MVTRLEIVQHMLFTVGEQIVVTVNSQHPSIIQAAGILDSTYADFSGRSWWFNTEYNMELAMDDTGKVTIPANAKSVEIVGAGASPIANRAQYAVRGGKIYDTINHTFILNTALMANVTIALNVEDLPHVAGTYLKHKAAETMYISDDGDSIKMDKLAIKVSEAWHLLKAEELRLSNVNALNSPSAAQLRYRIGQNSGGTNPRMPGGRY